MYRFRNLSPDGEVRIFDYVKENQIMGNTAQYSTWKKQMRALLKDFRSGQLGPLTWDELYDPIATLPVERFNAITSHDDGVSI